MDHLINWFTLKDQWFVSHRLPKSNNSYILLKPPQPVIIWIMLSVSADSRVIPLSGFQCILMIKIWSICLCQIKNQNFLNLRKSRYTHNHLVCKTKIQIKTKLLTIVVQWISLNVIALGPRGFDRNIWMITIS